MTTRIIKLTAVAVLILAALIVGYALAMPGYPFTQMRMQEVRDFIFAWDHNK